MPRKSINQIYSEEIKGKNPFSKEEENILVDKMLAGDKRARQKLITGNLKFVVKVASRYRNQGVAFSDLIAAGNIGLVRAADEFQKGKNVKFISYAVWWIKKEILEMMARQSRFVSVHAVITNQKHKLNKAISKLEQKYGRSPTLNEIHKATKMKREKIIEMITVFEPQVSLDSNMNNNKKKYYGKSWKEKITLESIIKDKKVKVDENIENEKVRNLIINHIDELSLSSKHKRVVKLYFGLEDGEPHTLDEIGEQYNQTKERIRQIKKEVVDSLKQLIMFKKIKQEETLYEEMI